MWKAMTRKNECWHCKGEVEKNMKGIEYELSNTQSCVTSTMDEGKILYNEATTIAKG